MQKVVLGARVVLGLIFVIFGLNFFVPFLPPPEMSEPATRFVVALMDTGYIFSVVKTIEVVSGVLLLVGIYVPLALVLLAPVIVNFVLLHVLLDPANLPLALVVLVLELFVAWSYRDSFSGVLNRRAKPTG